MKAFEYASPETESDVVSLLSSEPGQVQALAGGTDLVGLLRKMVLTPERVVNIKEVSSFRGIVADSTGATIGAVTTLDEILEHPDLDAYSALKDAILGINSMQLQSQGTLGGELCQYPTCWYFRNGYGLLQAANLIESGENQFHAILGNRGPAKFVNASRLAPALIALGASVRVIGPATGDQEGAESSGDDEAELSESIMPVELVYRIPKETHHRELTLAPSQLISHIVLPPAEELASATYEVRQSEGPDYPLASAACSLRFEGDRVAEATVVLGQVAPVPWVSQAAAKILKGRVINASVAEEAGQAAVAQARPMSQNGYKVQLARVSVKRAILKAAGLETGGF